MRHSNRNGDEEERQDKFRHTQRDWEWLSNRAAPTINVPITFLNILPVEAALVLQVLIQESVRVGQRSKIRRRRWFYFTVEQFEAITHIQRNPQQRILNLLIRKGYILVEKKGIPPRRWIAINAGKLRQDVNRSSSNTKPCQLNDTDPCSSLSSSLRDSDQQAEDTSNPLPASDEDEYWNQDEDEDKNWDEDEDEDENEITG